MNFDFKVFARSVPAICIVGGIALIVISKVSELGGGLIALGVLLILAGIGLQILYIYMKYKR
jgi:hypothetical protein